MEYIYLAGPMKGYPDKNFPMFDRVSVILKEQGHYVYSPHTYPDNGIDGFDIRKAFASYTNFISLTATAIVLLPGWEKSLGVSAELGLAINCGIKCCIWDDELETFHERKFQLMTGYRTIA